MNKVKRLFATGCLLAAGALGLAFSPQSQAGYLYTLDNVVFSDGTTATGTFSIEQYYGYAVESWNITTTFGVFAGYNYTPDINADLNNPLDDTVVFNRNPPDAAYNGYLQFTFADSLWGPGPLFTPPTSSLLKTGYSLSYECGTYAGNDGLCQGDYRSVVSGGVVSGEVTSVTSVPEPGTLALFGLGMAGLGFARRKRAA